jgi:phosphate starvation-inducible protein PhoH
MSRKAGRTRAKPTREVDVRFEQFAAAAEGPQRKKKWTKHDVKPIHPLTENQKSMFVHFYQGDNLAAIGSAGTGKSFLSCFLAISDVVDHTKDQKQVILVRSAVQSRDVGFMPGTLEEKNSYYETPYRDIFGELFGRASTYDDMKEAGMIQFMTTSFIRGLTWDDSIIVIDEAQNMTWEEINTIMTRVGKNSRIIVCGDVKQNDLIKKKSEVSGITKMFAVLKRMNDFSTITFTRDDIVRSEFVKQWIIATESVED